MKCINLKVLLFVFSLMTSLAMSIDELQDFSNFLKETSLLDQPLKKNPSSDDDDDVPISDHAWEESGRFEGDLILNDRQRQLIVQDIAEGLSRNGLKDSTKRWPNNEVIFYIQKEHFTGDQVQAILSGIEELGQASCVKFRPYRKGDRDAVVVQGSRRGCFSQVGYQGGYQVLNLSGRHPVGRGCFRHGTVVHEFLHTLGFYHMQSSPDRDDYIDVIWANIVQPARHNFRKYNLFSVSDFGVGYDYDSVLHYSRKAFSSNGGDTLVPKKSGAEIGQRVGLSDKDTAKLNKMYCDADSNNFEAADDVPHTPAHTPVIKKKKTPKNKPFEGQGIGYHQGKTVVFKLPAAETFRLPDTPSNQVFDYFSKTSQAMPPTLIKGFGVGKKITYSFKLPVGYQIVKQNGPIHSYPALFNRPIHAIKPVTRQDNIENKYDEMNSFKIDAVNKSKETIEDFDEKSIKENKMKKTDEAYNNFYTDGYKPNTDYSEYYNPHKNYKIGSRTDYYLNYFPESKSKQGNTRKEISNLKLTKQFLENLQAQQPNYFHTDNNKESKPFNHVNFKYKLETTVKPKTQTKDNSTLRGVDINFGQVYPYTKLAEIKNIPLLEQDYISKKYLENKLDYSSLYKPNDNLNRDSESRNEQYTLFRDPVPLTIKYVPIKNSNKRAEELDKLSSSKDDDEKTKEVAYLNEDPESKDAQYTLFGVPVPITLNYTPTKNANIHAEILGAHSSSKEVDEKIQGVEYPTNLPISNYKDYDSDKDEYSYEDFDPTENPKKYQPTPIMPFDDLSKSYEVTEKNIEHVVAVTEKSNIANSKSQDAHHELERRLPEILEKYANHDNYDITSPYIKYDADSS